MISSTTSPPSTPIKKLSAIQQFHSLVVKQITNHLSFYLDVINSGSQKNYRPAQQQQQKHVHFTQSNTTLYPHQVIRRFLYDILQLQNQSIEFILKEIFSYPKQSKWSLQQILRIVLDVQFVITVNNYIMVRVVGANNSMKNNHNNKDISLCRISSQQLTNIIYENCFFLPKHKLPYALIQQIVNDIDQTNGKKGYVLLVEYKTYMQNNMIQKHNVSKLLLMGNHSLNSNANNNNNELSNKKYNKYYDSTPPYNNTHLLSNSPSLSLNHESIKQAQNQQSQIMVFNNGGLQSIKSKNNSNNVSNKNSNNNSLIRQQQVYVLGDGNNNSNTYNNSNNNKNNDDDKIVNNKQQQQQQDRVLQSQYNITNNQLLQQQYNITNNPLPQQQQQYQHNHNINTYNNNTIKSNYNNSNSKQPSIMTINKQQQPDISKVKLLQSSKAKQQSQSQQQQHTLSNKQFVLLNQSQSKQQLYENKYRLQCQSRRQQQQIQIQSSVEEYSYVISQKRDMLLHSHHNDDIDAHIISNRDRDNNYSNRDRGNNDRDRDRVILPQQQYQYKYNNSITNNNPYHNTTTSSSSILYQKLYLLIYNKLIQIMQVDSSHMNNNMTAEMMIQRLKEYFLLCNRNMLMIDNNSRIYKIHIQWIVNKLQQIFIINNNNTTYTLFISTIIHLLGEYGFKQYHNQLINKQYHNQLINKQYHNQLINKSINNNNNRKPSFTLEKHQLLTILKQSYTILFTLSSTQQQQLFHNTIQQLTQQLFKQNVIKNNKQNNKQFTFIDYLQLIKLLSTLQSNAISQ